MERQLDGGLYEKIAVAMKPKPLPLGSGGYHDLLVGLHPGGALRQLGEAARVRPAVIIPCCNFWDEQRRGQYELLTAIEEFYRQHSIRFERIALDFKGPKNIAIVSQPT
ncbi:MAG: hypothetical protein OXC79_01610 [Candidatus Poribacteria bacterium]|nr:hypothetical protein [Candidatus Poribacteria bacterium]